MTKDVLLIRSNQYHLAVPTDRLLEIVNLDEYHAQQQINLASTTFSHKPDQYRLWRNHLLPVLHLGHFLEPTNKKQECLFGLVYQASNHETIYLDTDHVFGITHIDTSKMKPVYAPQKNFDNAHFTSGEHILAFVLEEDAKKE